MLTPRTSKTIAERVDIGFHRQGNRFRRWRWWMSIATLGVAMLLPAWAAIERNERVYEAGPVSTAHQLIANNCESCHTANWKPALRLGRLNDQVSSVPDKACTVCHAGPPHHKDQLDALTDCAACHREHRGRELLARVDDRYCTQCHDKLQTTRGDSTNFVRHIHDFATHPQFALFRSPDDVPPPSDHQVYQVAEPNVAEGSNRHWRDRTPLRFNHKKHCGPEGLLRADGTRRALNCERCHQVDMSSGYMQPINHEAHCAECHDNQLHFDEQRFTNTKVAHGPLDKVRAELLDRYADLAQRRPELAQDVALVEPEREVPGAAPKLSEAGWQWVHERVEKALDQLLRREKLGCRYCHTNVQSAGDDPRAWTVAGPQIPARWLRQAVFRHDRHQLLTCSECHDKTVESSLTDDILLPHIERCHECHGSRANRGTARSDCVECHTYHHGEGKEMDGPFSTGLSVVKPENVRQPPGNASGEQRGADK